jgi:hypothetical protein
MEDRLRTRVIFGKKVMGADSRREAVGFKSWLVGEQTLTGHAPTFLCILAWVVILFYLSHGVRIINALDHMT